MTFIERPERWLLRRALTVMADMALDELSDQELESMYDHNVYFLMEALEGVTDDCNRLGDDDPFSQTDYVRLEQLRDRFRTVLTDTGVFPVSLSDAQVELSEYVVKALQQEEAELGRRKRAIDSRLEVIRNRIVSSGESKVRSAREAVVSYNETYGGPVR